MYTNNRIDRQLIWDTTDKQMFCEDVLEQWPKEYGNEWVFTCIYHDDNNPSMYLNSTTGLLQCKACGTSGDFIQLTIDKLGITFQEALKLLAPTLVKHEQQLDVTWKDIAEMHNRLLNNNKYLRLVNKYGISTDIVKRFKLGIRLDKSCKRLVIPVNNDSKLVCVKYHRLNGNPFSKTLMASGSRAAMYPHNLLVKSNKLLLLEGEPDVLAAYSAGVDKFVTPVTNTNGCNSFKLEWCYKYFNRKTVYVCYDNDTAGTEAAMKIIDKLYGMSKVFVMKLPAKDMREYLKHHSAEDFKTVMNDAEEYNEQHLLYIKYRLYNKLKKLCRTEYEYKGFIGEIDHLFKF